MTAKKKDYRGTQINEGGEKNDEENKKKAAVIKYSYPNKTISQKFSALQQNLTIVQSKNVFLILFHKLREKVCTLKEN